MKETDAARLRGRAIEVIQAHFGEHADMIIAMVDDYLTPYGIEWLYEICLEAAAMQKARTEYQSERARQRDNQAAHGARAKGTITLHCTAHYNTARKAAHRARDRVNVVPGRYPMLVRHMVIVRDERSQPLYMIDAQVLTRDHDRLTVAEYRERYCFEWYPPPGIAHTHHTAGGNA